MKKRFILYIITALFVLGCSEDPEQEFSSAYPIAGEWIVKEYYEGGSVSGDYSLQIYSTAANKDSVWVNNIYSDHVRIRSRISDGSFDITDALDYSGGYGKATISNSQIIDKDSIYFEVILYNEDDEVEAEFVTAGKRWTGF